MKKIIVIAFALAVVGAASQHYFYLKTGRFIIACLF